MIPIDKNGPPIPTKVKYPWREMEVGDRFFVLNGKIRSLTSSAFQTGRRMNRKFSLRTVEGGVRVWRVS